MTRRVWLGAGIAVVTLCGCGTLLHGGAQTVEIRSDPSGATGLILPGGRKVALPATVELSRKRSHTVLVELDGYCTERAYVDRLQSPAFYGNILLGGMIGVSVDRDRGGAYALAPAVVEVTLRPLDPGRGEAGCREPPLD